MQKSRNAHRGNLEKKTKRARERGARPPSEIECGSETGEWGPRDDKAVATPCVSQEMPRRDNAAGEEPRRTRAGAEKKGALLHRGRRFLRFFRRRDMRIAQVYRLGRCVFPLKQSPLRILFVGLVLRPTLPASAIPEGVCDPPVSDARSSRHASFPPRSLGGQEGERESLRHIAAMKYTIVSCIGENGLTWGGVVGASVISVVRKNIEEGAPPVARGRFLGQKTNSRMERSWRLRKIRCRK